MNFLFPLNALKDALVYRFRGGGFFSTGHDWIVRLIWGASLILTYFSFSYHAPDWVYIATLLPTAYLSMLVPHAFCQNMGRWPTPQNGWPAFFMPVLTQTQWVAMPDAARTLFDFLSMAGVAGFRALFVFAPWVASHYLQTGEIALRPFLLAFEVLTIGQPLAYLLGWYVPLSVGNSLTKFSTEWCEFFNGAVWTVALWLLC